MNDMNVKQGDIVLIDFNPNKGHEQTGKRPALIVSNDTFNSRCNVVLVCPITSTDNKFPLHVQLDGRTKTKGVVLCEHIRSLDIESRGYRVLEQIPFDLLTRVIDIVNAEIEM